MDNKIKTLRDALGHVADTPEYGRLATRDLLPESETVLAHGLRAGFAVSVAMAESEAK